MDYPRVGVGLYVMNGDKVLLGLRKGKLEPGTWCATGGKLEWGEEPEAAGAREALEEAGVEVTNIAFVGFTNDWDEENQHHYITLQFRADWAGGEPALREPDKFERWEWFPWNALPEPQFIGLRKFVEKGYNPVTS